MSGGRFFNSLGYGQGTPNTQSNNINNNDNNGNFVGGTPGMMGNNPMQTVSQVPGNPMNSVSTMNPMANGNPMNQGNPVQNINMMSQGVTANKGMFINKDMAANQYDGPVYQDPVPSMNGQGNPMNNSMTGASQGFIGAQQFSTNPIANNKPMTLMSPNSGFASDNFVNNRVESQQQPIMMTSNSTPGFSKAFEVNSMGNPILQPVSQPKVSNLSMNKKLNVDLKKVFIIGAIVLVVILVILCIVGSKTITCVREDKIQGATAETSIKISYWFNKISKIETKVTWDISGLNSASKEAMIKTYENLDDGSDVDITDKKIVISKIHKPTKEAKEKGEDEVDSDDLIKEYESSGLVCK